MRGLITPVMKGFITLELNCQSRPALLRTKGDQKGIPPAHCHHHFGDDPDHHPVVLPHRRLGLGGGVSHMPLVASHADIRTLGVMGTSNPTRLVDPFHLSAGVTPAPALNGRCGIRLDPGGRRHAGTGVGLDVLTRPLAAR